MNRQEFLTVTKTALGSLLIQGHVANLGLGDESQTKPTFAESHDDDYYLSKGLIGMASAEGWFDAHWGAAVIAGAFLCREVPLDDETAHLVKQQLDAMIQLRPNQFKRKADEPSQAMLLDEIPRSLMLAVKDGLRAHGHAVIFAAMALRVLKQLPHLAQPRLVADLSRLSNQIAKQSPRRPLDSTPYTDSQSMITATFASLARFENVLGYPSIRRPNFTHMTTHTEAIATLEELGFGDVALACHPGHRAHIDEPTPTIDPKIHTKVESEFRYRELMHSSFWSDQTNHERWNKAWNEHSNPNGYWVAFGHLFKVLYSLNRLIQRSPNDPQIAICSQIVLERYQNPNIRGG